MEGAGGSDSAPQAGLLARIGGAVQDAVGVVASVATRSNATATFMPADGQTGIDNMEEGNADSSDEESDEMDLMEAGILGADENVIAATAPAAKKRQYFSVAHDDIIAGKIVYIHLDIEHGGPNCGILQLSTISISCIHECRVEGH